MCGFGGGGEEEVIDYKDQRPYPYGSLLVYDRFLLGLLWFMGIVVP